MNIYLNFYTGLSVVLLAITAGAYKLKQTDITGRIFFMTMIWYFFTQFVTEGGLLYKDIGINRFTTFYYAVRNAQPLIEYTLFVLFFHFSIKNFRQRKLAHYLVPLGMLLWGTCLVVFSEAENALIYFTPFVCVVMVTLSLLSLNVLLDEMQIGELRKEPVFWFVVLILFFYVTYFFFCIFYTYLLMSRKAELLAIYIIFRITDIYYIGAAITFFLYRKKTMQVD